MCVCVRAHTVSEAKRERLLSTLATHESTLAENYYTSTEDVPANDYLYEWDVGNKGVLNCMPIIFLQSSQQPHFKGGVFRRPGVPTISYTRVMHFILIVQHLRGQRNNGALERN